MKTLNVVISIACLILILFSLCIESGLDTDNNNSANSGMGTFVIFAGSLLINSVASIILFVIVLVVGIVKKQLFKPYTLLNIGLIALTFFFPFL